MFLHTKPLFHFLYPPDSMPHSNLYDLSLNFSVFRAPPYNLEMCQLEHLMYDCGHLCFATHIVCGDKCGNWYPCTKRLRGEYKKCLACEGMEKNDRKVEKVDQEVEKVDQKKEKVDRETARADSKPKRPDRPKQGLYDGCIVC